MRPGTLPIAAAVCGLLAGCGGPGSETPPPPKSAKAPPRTVGEPPTAEGKATALVSRLAQGNFAAACKDFDPGMQRRLPPATLEQVWKSLTDKVGPLQKQAPPRTEPGGNLDVFYITCTFAKASFDAKVVFTRNGKITGFWFVPPKPTAAYHAPDYVDPREFRETEIMFGRRGWELPASLCLPEGAGTFPAVVLVHGSVPQDRDETIGPNRPFRDLAWGLASRGIAVLRYDKRTRAHAVQLASLKSLTVKQEVIDDVLEAVAFLRRIRTIDRTRIFVLGHSLGAMLLPEFGARKRRIAGLISLAGATRSVEDALLGQVDYVHSLKTGAGGLDKAEMDKLRKQVVRMKDPNFSAKTPASDLPGGVPAVYWLSLRRYHPANTVAKARQPMLILQGGRDYQVTKEDFEGWKKLLAGRTNVRFRLYPGLNHLFIPGEGQITPTEYEKAGHVDRVVVDDIADWIKGVK